MVPIDFHQRHQHHIYSTLTSTLNTKEQLSAVVLLHPLTKIRTPAFWVVCTKAKLLVKSTAHILNTRQHTKLWRNLFKIFLNKCTHLIADHVQHIFHPDVALMIMTEPRVSVNYLGKQAVSFMALLQVLVITALPSNFCILIASSGSGIMGTNSRYSSWVISLQVTKIAFISFN